MPYKDPERQAAYVRDWKRQHTLDGLGVIERERMAQCEQLVEAALRANEFVSLRKAVQECIKLLQRLIEGR
jgi:hypothetical protein